MPSRGLREVWEGWSLSRKCFRALRLQVALRGPADAARRRRLQRHEKLSQDSAEPHLDTAEGERSLEAWSLASAFFYFARHLTPPDSSEDLLGAAIHAARQPVILRASGSGAAARTEAKAAEKAARRARAEAAATTRRALRASIAAAARNLAHRRAWERLNSNHAATLLRGGTRRKRAREPTAAGSNAEKRQAAAQRAHAAAAQRDFDAAMTSWEKERDAGPTEPPTPDGQRSFMEEGIDKVHAAGRPTWRAALGGAQAGPNEDKVRGPPKPPWRPPGTGLRSGVLGSRAPAFHLDLGVAAAGSASGKGVAIGKGIRGKGAFPHGRDRARRMAIATELASKRLKDAEGTTDQREHNRKRSREESDELNGKAASPAPEPGVPRYREQAGEGPGRSRSGPTSIL